MELSFNNLVELDVYNDDCFVIVDTKDPFDWTQVLLTENEVDELIKLLQKAKEGLS